MVCMRTVRSFVRLYWTWRLKNDKNINQIKVTYDIYFYYFYAYVFMRISKNVHSNALLPTAFHLQKKSAAYEFPLSLHSARNIRGSLRSVSFILRNFEHSPFLPSTDRVCRAMLTTSLGKKKPFSDENRRGSRFPSAFLSDAVDSRERDSNWNR